MNALLDTLRGFGAIKVGLMALVSMALIGAFSMIAMRIVSPALSPLYSNLSPEDSAKIIGELGKLGVPYETNNNGSQITVPADRVLRLRMNMAELGLPTNGSVTGYEIFDRTDAFGSSNMIMSINMVRALEGELARTINSFNQVESARVHLVIPRHELFSRERQEPSASVALKLRGGQELSKNEVAAITHFVAAAVPGLKPGRVNVVDSYGRLLARGDGQESIGAVAAAAEEYRVAFENRTRDMLENLIEKVVGPGKVKVEISADMNFDRITTDSEKFDPEGQVARSVQSTSEKDNSQDTEGKDAVTVGNQVPGGANAGGAGGNNSKHATEKDDSTTNYEISKTVQKQIREGGTVNKLSVAVLVDSNDKASLPAEEMKHIDELVKSAIGFDEKRGDNVQVVSMPFTHVEETKQAESFFASFKNEMQGIVQTLIIAGVAILAILVVLRPLITHLMRITAASAERASVENMAALGAGGGGTTQVMMRLPGGGVAPAGSGGGGQTVIMTGPSGGGGTTIVEEEEDEAMINLENVKGRVRSSSLRKVVDFVDKNPNETVNVMRQWMIKDAAV